jgi:hypothetical protein
MVAAPGVDAGHRVEGLGRVVAALSGHGNGSAHEVVTLVRGAFAVDLRDRPAVDRAAQPGAWARTVAAGR